MMAATPRVAQVRGGDWHSVGDRSVWSPLVAVWDMPGDIELRLGIEVRQGVPEIREVSLRSMGTGRAIRASDLRMKLDDLIEDAVKEHALLTSKPEDQAWRDSPFGRRELAANPQAYAGEWLRPAANDQERQTSQKSVQQARRRPRRKVTDELLREIAEVYRANVDDRPTQAVRERYAMPQSTAALYVRRARDAGYLGKAIEGKAGERS